MLEYVFLVKRVSCNLTSQHLENVLNQCGSVELIQYTQSFLLRETQWKDNRKIDNKFRLRKIENESKKKKVVRQFHVKLEYGVIPVLERQPAHGEGTLLLVFCSPGFPFPWHQVVRPLSLERLGNCLGPLLCHLCLFLGCVFDRLLHDCRDEHLVIRLCRAVSPSSQRRAPSASHMSQALVREDGCLHCLHLRTLTFGFQGWVIRRPSSKEVLPRDFWAEWTLQPGVQVAESCKDTWEESPLHSKKQRPRVLSV